MLVGLQDVIYFCCSCQKKIIKGGTPFSLDWENSF